MSFFLLISYCEVILLKLCSFKEIAKKNTKNHVCWTRENFSKNNITSFAPQERRLIFGPSSAPDYPFSIFSVSFVFKYSSLLSNINTSVGRCYLHLWWYYLDLLISHLVGNLRFVKICLDIFRFAWICLDLFRLVYVCLYLFIFVYICSDWYILL